MKRVLIVVALVWAAVITRYVVRLDLRDQLRPAGEAP